jgi:quercetin dioxygenase-like cupin family protein
MPGYVTILAQAEIEPGVSVPRHTHPGVSYLLEGNLDLAIQGQPTRLVKAGESWQVPPETPHASAKPTETKIRILSTYVVEKGKPLASPA